MRVTFQSQFRDSSAAIEKTAERLLEAQRRVGSGKRLDRISDDPTAAATSVAEHNQLAQVDQYVRATDSVGSRLAVIDTVLSDIVDKLTAARATAMSARGSVKTAAERNAAALELGGLRDALVDNLNTSFHGAYLFGGAATAKPYVVPGGGTFATYQGSNNGVQVDVGDGRAITVGLDGEAITRGSDAQDVFETLDALITAVDAGDNDGIGAGIDALQRAFDRAISAQTRVGTDMQAIDAQKVRLQQMRQSGGERLSKLEDLNMAEAITQMSHADAAYRASLGAVSSVSRVSLLDYLK